MHAGYEETVLHLVTDSACTHRWVIGTLSGKASVNTKAICKILIRRPLETLHALIKEYDLVICAKLDSARIK